MIPKDNHLKAALFQKILSYKYSSEVQLKSLESSGKIF